MNVRRWNYETECERTIDCLWSVSRGCFIPVSYTHLDVYKRQILGAVWKSCNIYTASFSIRMGCHVHFAIVICDDFRILIQRIDILHSFTEIQRLHNILCYEVTVCRCMEIDVYKRQIKIRVLKKPLNKGFKILLVEVRRTEPSPTVFPSWRKRSASSIRRFRSFIS